jgi:hypothetical protein
VSKKLAVFAHVKGGLSPVMAGDFGSSPCHRAGSALLGTGAADPKDLFGGALAQQGRSALLLFVLFARLEGPQ